MVSQVEDHPVELFAEPWPGGSAPADLLVRDVLAALALDHHRDEALLRVAVPNGNRQHRCLDINGVGYGNSPEEVNGEPIVELTVERWDEYYQTIRDDEPEA